MKVVLLFSLYKLTDSLLVGNTITVVHLVPIAVFCIAHLKFEGTVIADGYADQFFGHGFDIRHDRPAGE